MMSVKKEVKSFMQQLASEAPELWQSLLFGYTAVGVTAGGEAVVLSLHPTYAEAQRELKRSHTLSGGKYPRTQIYKTLPLAS